MMASGEGDMTFIANHDPTPPGAWSAVLR